MVNVKRALLTVAIFVSFLVICVGTGTDYWATADKASGVQCDTYFGLYNIHLDNGLSANDYTITPDCKIKDGSTVVFTVDSQCNNVRGEQGFAILSVLTSFAAFLASIAFASTNPKGSGTAAGVLLVLAAFFGMLCMAIFIEARQNNRGPLFNITLPDYNWTYGYSAGIFIFGWLLALVCAVFTFLSNKHTDD